jgi:hypothetical protein
LLNSLTHEERKEFIRIQILLLTKRKQNWLEYILWYLVLINYKCTP